MNLLDENIPVDQRALLERWGIATHQIGHDVGRAGMKDKEILPLLHRSRGITFFTRDQGFYNRNLCHPRNGVVCLAVAKNEVAVFVRRVLRHREFSSKFKRMGAVLRASHARLSVWRPHALRETRLEW